MAPTFFRILLAFVAAYVLWRGSRDEREVGIVLVLGVIATHLVISPLKTRFASVETHVFAVDLIVFMGFLWVALRSERFWPLWIAGLQLTAIMGHVLKAVDIHLFSKAYAAAMVFWSYPIVLILAVGTWRSHRRYMRHRDTAPS
jgi:cyanate permease